MDQEFSEELKQRQRYWLEHLRAARAQGVTLAEYARAAQMQGRGDRDAQRAGTELAVGWV